MKRNLLFCLTFYTLIHALFAQSAINHPLDELNEQLSQISYSGEHNYILTERTDLRLYKNGKYVGLESREISSFIIPVFKDNQRIYEGNFYVNKDTKHNQQLVKDGIHRAIPASFTIDNEGNLTMIEDNGYPSFRSFPSFTTQKIKKGDSWTASAVRIIDPLDKGVITRLPLQIQYTYVGDEMYHDEEVYLITAKWATRYGIIGKVNIMDWGGDYELESATGAHSATMYVSKKNGTALVIRDTVDETFFYTDGNYYQYKGTITLFTEYPPAVNHDKIIPALRRIAREEEKNIDSVENALDNGQIASGTVKTSSDSAKSSSQSGTKTSSAGGTKIASGGEGVSSGSASGISTGKASGSSSGKSSGSSSSDDSIPAKYTNLKFETTESGIKLIIEDLHFEADSAKLLDGENERLADIAEILKQAENSKFLIEGHTASVGNPDGELKLSYERAESIAKKLSAFGIKPEQFICKGSGGLKPVASNDTSAGRARNRRVEITILE